MGRRRVQHELISKESVRKVTFKKRRAGLKKKLSELTTLCGVTACAIICASFDHQPEIWPSPAEAVRVLDKFNNFPIKRRDMNNFDCLEDLKDLDHLLKEKIKVIADKIECEMGLKSIPANTDGHNIRPTKGG
ncbi:Agamous-like MADS-box protein AGL80 [Citrus sinensis]|uniref:Agamous-like MADS-box protein AGL80 n=1 Tax=Citrus sinensis TaxID=2711 RepID=A0ACB8KUY3_CITSI|nr:Agamous-like MADS-box protein AGL80 [Citrus sinensis]